MRRPNVSRTLKKTVARVFPSRVCMSKQTQGSPLTSPSDVIIIPAKCCGGGQVNFGAYCFSHQCDFTPRTTSSVRSPIIYPAHSLLLILGAFWLTPTFYSSYNSLKSDRNKCPGNKTQRWETYVSLPHLLPRWVTGAAAHIPKPPAFRSPLEWRCVSSGCLCPASFLMEWLPASCTAWMKGPACV